MYLAWAMTLTLVLSQTLTHSTQVRTHTVIDSVSVVTHSLSVSDNVTGTACQRQRQTSHCQASVSDTVTDSASAVAVAVAVVYKFNHTYLQNKVTHQQCAPIAIQRRSYARRAIDVAKRDMKVTSRQQIENKVYTKKTELASTQNKYGDTSGFLLYTFAIHIPCIKTLQSAIT